jgi:hypothetical protein
MARSEITRPTRARTSPGNALENLLSLDTYQNLSINGAIAKYAPAFENNTAAYPNFISNQVGVAGKTILRNLTSRQFNSVANGIWTFEGYRPGTITPVGGQN